MIDNHKYAAGIKQFLSANQHITYHADSDTQALAQTIIHYNQIPAGNPSRAEYIASLSGNPKYSTKVLKILAKAPLLDVVATMMQLNILNDSEYKFNITEALTLLSTAGDVTIWWWTLALSQLCYLCSTGPFVEYTPSKPLSAYDFDPAAFRSDVLPTLKQNFETHFPDPHNFHISSKALDANTNTAWSENLPEYFEALVNDLDELIVADEKAGKDEHWGIRQYLSARVESIRRSQKAIKTPLNNYIVPFNSPMVRHLKNNLGLVESGMNLVCSSDFTKIFD